MHSTNCANQITFPFEIVLVGGCGGDGVGLIAGIGW